MKTRQGKTKETNGSAPPVVSPTDVGSARSPAASSGASPKRPHSFSVRRILWASGIVAAAFLSRWLHPGENHVDRTDKASQPHDAGSPFCRSLAIRTINRMEPRDLLETLPTIEVEGTSADRSKPIWLLVRAEGKQTWRRVAANWIDQDSWRAVADLPLGDLPEQRFTIVAADCENPSPSLFGAMVTAKAPLLELGTQSNVGINLKLDGDVANVPPKTMVCAFGRTDRQPWTLWASTAPVGRHWSLEAATRRAYQRPSEFEMMLILGQTKCPNENGVGPSSGEQVRRIKLTVPRPRLAIRDVSKRGSVGNQTHVAVAGETEDLLPQENVYVLAYRDANVMPTAWPAIRSEARWSAVCDLPPGRYRLSAALLDSPSSAGIEPMGNSNEVTVP